MKTSITKPVVWAAVAGLILSPSAFAKKKPLNLTAFEGQYTGTVTLVTPSDSTSGSATVTISVPKNGKSATILYLATTVSPMGDTTLLPTAATLASNKTVSVTDLGVGIAGTNNAHPGTGTWSQQRRTLSLFATNGDTDLRGTLVAQDVHKKRKLALTLVSADSGASYVFTTTLTSKLKKPKN